MATVSVTRLHLRSLRFFVPFSLRALASQRQAARSHGFLGGHLALEPIYGFWTITAWTSPEAMRDFRNSGAHRDAMPRLLSWCDEASFASWDQATADLPSMETVHDVLRSRGRVSKVRHPSAAHQEGKTTSDRRPLPGLSFQAASGR